MTGKTLWLLPDPESAAKIHTIIVKLSDTFSTPPFYPHITLSSVPDISLKELRYKVNLIASEASPFWVELNKPKCGEPTFHRFTSAAYPIDPFRELSETCDRIFDGKYAKREFFHISLLYGQTPCSELYQAFDELIFSMPIELHIQNLALTDTSGPVNNWREIHSASLL
jgi:hypothetical protein